MNETCVTYQISLLHDSIKAYWQFSLLNELRRFHFRFTNEGNEFQLTYCNNIYRTRLFI